MITNDTSKKDQAHGAPLPERGLAVSDAFGEDFEAECEQLKAALEQIQEENPEIAKLAGRSGFDVHSSERSLHARIQFLKKSIAIANSKSIPSITTKRNSWNLGGGESVNPIDISGYSIGIKNTPIIKIVKDETGRNFVILIAEGRRERFRTHRGFSTAFFGMEPGLSDRANYVSHSLNIEDYSVGGALLIGPARRVAAAFFHQVRNGKRITPADAEGIIQEALIGEGTGGVIVPQHWGQEYLAGLKPKKVTPGILIGSGDVSNGYHFCAGTIEVIVVEPNRFGKATLIVSKEGLEKLPETSRSVIRKNPSEFPWLKLRLPHPDNSLLDLDARQVWKDQIDKLVAKARDKSGS